MINRRHRMFHADVILNAPKDRTLFNYNVKVFDIHYPCIFLHFFFLHCCLFCMFLTNFKFQDGWPKLRDYLGLPASDDKDFPHENKAN